MLILIEKRRDPEHTTATAHALLQVASIKGQQAPEDGSFEFWTMKKPVALLW